MQPEFYSALTKLHRTRQFAMDKRKREGNALGAFLREQLGWSLRLPKEDRDAIAERAQELIALGKKVVVRNAKLAAKPDGKYKEIAGADGADFQEWRDFIVTTVSAEQPFGVIEQNATDLMEQMVADLPVAEWWKENVFAGSLVSLAVIIAETGDLANYATHCKVWKRMGLAVMEYKGVMTRQGGLAKGADKKEWITHGYSPRRRSAMFVIGDALVKGNEHYNAICRARKEYERAKAEAAGITVVPAAKIPKDKEKAKLFISDGHIKKRAERYMTKRLLRDLYGAWRRATTRLYSIPIMPAADTNAPQGAESANLGVLSQASVELRSPTDTADEAIEQEASTSVNSTANLPPALSDPGDEPGERLAKSMVNPIGRLPDAPTIPIAGKLVKRRAINPVPETAIKRLPAATQSAA